ncbi:MAG: isoprenylcysteine carboxylmethyltransferase family protein [Pseudomonadota bacterium]
MHIPPPLIAAAVAVVMIGIHQLPLPDALRFSLPAAVHFGIGLLGIAVAVAGVAQFRRHQTTINPIKIDAATTLVTNGVFRWSRNPMYLGMLVFLIAIGIKLGNMASLMSATLFIPIVTTLQIKPEEAVMRRLFGAAFERYCQTTRRWL